MADFGAFSISSLRLVLPCASVGRGGAGTRAAVGSLSVAGPVGSVGEHAPPSAVAATAIGAMRARRPAWYKEITPWPLEQSCPRGPACFKWQEKQDFHLACVPPGRSRARRPKSDILCPAVGTGTRLR